jgi:hypothetical protein
MLGLVAMVAVGMLLLFGNDTNSSLQHSGNAIDSSTGHTAFQ